MHGNGARGCGNGVRGCGNGAGAVRTQQGGAGGGEPIRAGDFFDNGCRIAGKDDSISSMIGKIQQTTLPNGSRVVTSQMDTVESVSICIDFGGGSRHEKLSECGYSHFLEHLIFKGSERYPTPKAISHPIESIGGSLNASTGLEQTGFFAVVPYDGLPLALDILTDMVSRPIFDQSNVELERNVVFSEMRMSHDDDFDYLSQQAMQGAWPGNAVGRPILGSREVLSEATAERLHAFRQSHYTAGSAIVAAAGKLEHERLVDLVRPFLEQLPPGPVPGYRRVRNPPPMQRFFCERRDATQVQTILTFRSIPYSDEHRSEQMLLAMLLGGSSYSRLFQSLRERSGLSYMVDCMPMPLSDCGVFQILASLNPEGSLKAMRLCAKELRSLCRKPVPAKELTRELSRVIGASRIGGESSRSQMGRILKGTRLLGRVESTDEVIERLRKVTPESLHAFASNLFRKENLSLSLILPETEKKTGEEHLEALEI